MTRNPWVSIPLKDYEAHMSLPSVAQSSYLRDVLIRWISSLQPSSVAVPGCAGGSGFDVLLSSGVRRVVGIDINASFLAALQRRFGGKFPSLEVLHNDIVSPDCFFEPVKFIFVALVFEYVNPEVCLQRLRTLVTPGGRIGVILQESSPGHAPVTPGPYASLASLQEIMKLVPRSDFKRLAAAAGFAVLEERQETLGTGKSFSELLLKCRS